MSEFRFQEEIAVGLSLDEQERAYDTAYDTFTRRIEPEVVEEKIEECK